MDSRFSGGAPAEGRQSEADLDGALALHAAKGAPAVWPKSKITPPSDGRESRVLGPYPSSQIRGYIELSMIKRTHTFGSLNSAFGVIGAFADLMAPSWFSASSPGEGTFGTTVDARNPFRTT